MLTLCRLLELQEYNRIIMKDEFCEFNVDLDRCSLSLNEALHVKIFVGTPTISFLKTEAFNNI